MEHLAILLEHVHLKEITTQIGRLTSSMPGMLFTPRRFNCACNCLSSCNDVKAKPFGRLQRLKRRLESLDLGASAPLFACFANLVRRAVPLPPVRT